MLKDISVAFCPGVSYLGKGFLNVLSGFQGEEMARQDTHTQRCFCASTSTKNPAYRDIMYAKEKEDATRMES